MNRTLQSLTATARTAIGAGSVLVLAPTEDDRLEIVASANAPAPADPIDPSESYAGMVLTSEQPMALQVRSDDPRVAAEARLLGRVPTAICCVPCAGADDITGVLSLVDKVGGGGFDFDDIEIATMLAEIAGTALEERGGLDDVPAPEQLSAAILELARSDTDRYRRIAPLVETVLGSG